MLLHDIDTMITQFIESSVGQRGLNDGLTFENVTRYQNTCILTVCAKSLAEQLRQTRMVTDHVNTKVGYVVTVEGDDADERSEV